MLRRRLSVLLAAVMMAVMMFPVPGPALAEPNGNNGNHFGDVRHPDNGKHVGGGSGGGKLGNPGKGNNGIDPGPP